MYPWQRPPKRTRGVGTKLQPLVAELRIPPFRGSTDGFIEPFLDRPGDNS